MKTEKEEWSGKQALSPATRPTTRPYFGGCVGH